MDRDLSNIIGALRQAGNLEEAKTAFAEGLARYGISNFTYGGVRLPRSANPDPIVLTTYPGDWVSNYLERGYRDLDPVVMAGQGALLPFSWSTLAPKGKAREVLEEGRLAGLRCGLSVPAHGVASEFALVSLASDETEQEFERLLREHEHSLHVLALHFHACVSAIAASRPSDTPVRLTKRETEVLTWVAHGKTTWEISEILKVSEATVVFHVENAKKKLGSFSRSFAVARAMTLGLLRI